MATRVCGASGTRAITRDVKILIASVDALPKMGGISTMMHHLANGFVESGHDVICLGPKGTYVPLDFQRHYELIEDWESQTSRRSGTDALEEDKRIEELFSSIISREKVDRILLLHPFYYGIGALDAADATGVPLSVYFHGFELRSQLNNNYPKNHAAILRNRTIGTLRERTFYLIGAANEILVNSTYTAKLFSGFPICPPVYATGCGIPLATFEREVLVQPNYSFESKVARRRELELPSGSCIAYVGRLVPTKGVHRIFEIVRETSNHSAVIVGDGPDRERLEELTKKYHIKERVRFLGQISEEEKWETLRAADYLALLSCPDEVRGQVEGFGIALLEGAAAACIPLSSGTGGMTDVVGSWETGIVDKGDLKEIVSDLEFVSRRSELAVGLVRRAREQVRRRYNWKSVAMRILERW